MLSDVICLHVDDMYKFDHCGRQYEKHPNGEITTSMKTYIQNLEKVCLTRECMKQTSSQQRKVMSSDGSMDVCTE